MVIDLTNGFTSAVSARLCGEQSSRTDTRRKQTMRKKVVELVKKLLKEGKPFKVSWDCGKLTDTFSLTSSPSRRN